MINWILSLAATKFNWRLDELDYISCQMGDDKRL